MPFTSSQDVKIFWDESGAGDPLLLIMGLSYTSDMWHRSIPELSPHYRTIFFDNRGVGKSDVPPGPYPIATMAADAAAVLDAANVKQAHIVGASMGGMIAQEFALQYPDRVRSLVLGCTTCGGSKSIAADPMVLQTLMARGNMSAEEGAQAMVPFIYDPETPRERIEEDLAIRRRNYPTAAGYFAQIQGIMSWSSFDRLSQIKARTLILHGEHDRLVPPQNARILADHITGSKLVMLPHSSHIFMTDEPEASHGAVLEFLKNTGQGSARV